MQMEYLLVAVFAAVDQQAIAVFGNAFLFGYLRRHHKQVPQ